MNQLSSILYSQCAIKAKTVKVFSLLTHTLIFLAWTSRKLKSQSLYIENETKRFEITIEQVLDDVFHEYDTYKISEVNSPFIVDNDFMR